MIIRPGGRGANGASISRHRDHYALGHMAEGRHNGVRRPSNRSFIKGGDENYQLKVGHYNPRAAAANAAIQRGS